MTGRILSAIAIILGWILLAVSCTSTRQTISNADNLPASVEDQLASGAPIYRQTCATSACHGTQGEGIRSGSGFSAWPLVGQEFQSRHPNAQVVFDVIRSGNESNLLALTDQQIYDAIAYQLEQNQITLESTLTAGNAFTTYGGAMSGKVQSGLFPPSENAVLLDMPLARDLPRVAQNNRLRIQVDQLAQASAIGKDKGTFLIVVMAFSDLNNQPLTISPDHLRLSTPDGELLKPQSLNLHSAIEKFHKQTIKPQYGTVGLGVFTLTAPEQFDQLIYDGAGEQLILDLKP